MTAIYMKLMTHTALCASVLALILATGTARAQAYDDGLPRSTPEAQGVKSEAIAEAATSWRCST